MKPPRLLPALVITAVLLGGVRPHAAAQSSSQNGNLSILFTGDVQGEIASCGCPTEDLGGASRRAAFQDTLKSRGWEFLVLDAGGVVPFPPLNQQKLLKAEALAKAHGVLGIDGMALGDNDLAQGADYVAQLMEWLGQPIIATNIVFPDSARYPSVRSRQYQVREPRVGVLAFLDPQLVTEDHAWLSVEPWEAQQDRVEDLDSRVDVLVAMACVADSTRLEDLARLYPQIDFLIGSRRGKLHAGIWHVGSTTLIGAGTLGRYLGRAEIVLDENNHPTDVLAKFLPVREEWGKRPRVTRFLDDYTRSIRKLVMSGVDPETPLTPVDSTATGKTLGGD